MKKKPFIINELKCYYDNRQAEVRRFHLPHPH